MWYTKIKPPALYSETQTSLPRPSPISCDASTNTDSTCTNLIPRSDVSTNTKLTPPSQDACTNMGLDLPSRSAAGIYTHNPTPLTAPVSRPIASSFPALYQGDVRDYVCVTNRTLNQLKRVEIVKPGEGVKVRNYIGRRNALRRLTDCEYIKLAQCSNLDESKWSTTYCYTADYTIQNGHQIFIISYYIF